MMSTEKTTHREDDDPVAVHADGGDADAADERVDGLAHGDEAAGHGA